MKYILFAKNRAQKLLKKVEINRPVFFALLTRAWTIVAGLLTAVLIVSRFSAEAQGYYYAFISLLAMQVFVELGFGTTIVQFASHEWAKLSLDQNRNIVGNEDAFSRLASLVKIAMRWYGIGGLILAIILTFSGCLFFSSSNSTVLFWKMPWVTISILTCVSLPLIPVWSILEGCNQVSQLYTFRFIKSVLSSLALWIAILSNFGLWALAIVNIVSFLCAIIFIYMRYRNFFRSLFFSKVSGPSIEWHTEILPLQWRMALAWVFGYFTVYLFTPVMFRMYGPVEAGRMGLTLSLIGVISSISVSLIMPNVPLFGILINRKEFDKLDKKFWRITRSIFLLSLALSSFIFMSVYIINLYKLPFAGRILSPLPVAIFLLAAILHGLFSPMGYYLLAHKKMPILWVSILTGILTCFSTLVLGRLFGSTGVAFGYFLVNCFALFAIRSVWLRCKRHWHQENGLALNG